MDPTKSETYRKIVDLYDYKDLETFVEDILEYLPDVWGGVPTDRKGFYYPKELYVYVSRKQSRIVFRDLRMDAMFAGRFKAINTYDIPRFLYRPTGVIVTIKEHYDERYYKS